MKVYVLIAGFRDDFDFIGVFATLESLEAAKAAAIERGEWKPADFWSPKEFTIDETND